MRAARTATASRSGSVVSPMTRLSGLAATALIVAAAPARRSYQPPGHVVLSAPSMSARARVASSASVTCASWPSAVRDDGDIAKLERDSDVFVAGPHDTTWPALTAWVDWPAGRDELCEVRPACWYRHGALLEELSAPDRAWHGAYFGRTGQAG